MPQSIRSRPQILSGYAERRIAPRSEWRRSMCARTRRTIAEFQSEKRHCFAHSFALGLLGVSRRIRVNPSAFAETTFIQPRDDFFHGPRDRSDISLLVATNPVLALLNDVAVPARSNHIRGRIAWLHRHDFVVFFVQSDRSSLPLTYL